MQKTANNKVLVLKSEFNTSWNYFSASQLGDTIIGFWCEWLARAESDQLGSIRFPKFTANVRDLEGISEALTTPVHTVGGLKAIPDLRKIGFLDRQMIVSRKRTCNLFDLTTLWKKLVLSGFDHEVSDHSATVIDTHIDGDNDNSNVDEYIPEGRDHAVDQQTAFEQGFLVRDGSPVCVHQGIALSDSD